MALVMLSSHHWRRDVALRCRSKHSKGYAAHRAFMHRRWYVLCLVSVAIVAGCSHPRSPGTFANPEWAPAQASSANAGRQSLGDPSSMGPRHGCPGGLTADECTLVDATISALEKHPAYQCRSVGDSARARLYRGQLDVAARTLGARSSHRPVQMGATGQSGSAWIGADQFDRRAILMEAMTRSLTTDSLRRDSVAALCRHSTS